MRNFVRDVFSTTGITIIILVTIGAFLGGSRLFFSTVYQSLAANIIIHIGIILINKIEIRNPVVEFTVKIGYLFLIIIPAGIFCKWYSTMPLWGVIVTGLLVYVISCFINIIRVNNDIKFINKQLENRKEEDKMRKIKCCLMEQ
jgi:hypothetical protein